MRILDMERKLDAFGQQLVDINAKLARIVKLLEREGCSCTPSPRYWVSDGTPIPTEDAEK